MVKLILVAVIRMFASFVNYTMPEEDIEVYTISEQEAEEIDNYEMDELINYEFYLDKEEDELFNFKSIMAENGEEYYVVNIDVWEEFNFYLITDDNYKMLYYSCDRY
jgi:hypothetical protein